MKIVVTDEMLASVEDHRSLADKKIDGEADESHDDNNQANGQKRSAGSSGSGSKKLRVAVVPKKKTKTLELVDLFMDTTTEKRGRSKIRDEISGKRSEKKFELKERKLELEERKHNDNFELQRSEMRLREREMQLREDDAKIRKMELQLLLRNKD